MISEYLERLAGELDFDPPLSRRVRREVEDHLREAVAADPMGGGPEAERRAVLNFGDARAIAAQFAVGSLARRARRVGVAAVLMTAAVFVAMKARLAWYGLMEYQVLNQVGTLGETVRSIDRYAFWLSVLASVAAWVYIENCRIPAAFIPEYCARLRRFFGLCLVATGALITSVLSDGVLTSLRLATTEWSGDFLIPVLSMAIEVACVGAMVSHFRGAWRRAAFTPFY